MRLVRRRLEELQAARLNGPLSDDGKAEYERLIEDERRLLERRK